MSRAMTVVVALFAAAGLAGCGDDHGHDNVDPTLFPPPGPPVDTGGGSTTTDGLLVDLDGDGVPDLVVADSGGDLSVAPGNGDGTFGTPVNLAAGTSLAGAVAADIDGDGDLDLVTIDAGADSVRIFTNDGDGNLAFDSAIALAAGADPADLAVVDVNGDGILDIVVVNGGTNDLAIALGAGGGAFGAPALTLLDPTIGDPTALVVADFDGNGDVDFAVAGSLGSVQTLLGDGLGGISGSSTLVVALTSSLSGLVAGDFDEDGDLDLAASEFVDGEIHILLNNGAGVFSLGNTYDAGSNAAGLLTADLDLDGHLDLAVGAGAVVAVLLGNGDGTFGPVLTFPASGGATTELAVADLNGDGSPDLIAADGVTGGVTVLLGADHSISIAFATGVEVPLGLGANPDDVVVVDLNSDGDPDLVTTDALLGTVRVALGNGDGTFDPATSTLVGVGVNGRALAIGDIDEDGDVDVVVALGVGAAIGILEGNGLGGLSLSIPVLTGLLTQPSDVLLVDVDMDGHLDLVATIGDFLSIALGVGDGSFAAATTLSLGAGFQANAVVAGDWDSNGLVDLAVASSANGTVSIHLGTGGGAFAAPVVVVVDAGDDLSGIAAGDLDRDGDLDLAVTNRTEGTVRVLLNNGLGAFAVTIFTPGALANASAIALADVDRDGDLDAVVTSDTLGTVAVLAGTGGGAFSGVVGFSTSASGSGAVAVGDVNHDGRVDLVTANKLLDASASVLLNVGF